MSLFLAALPIIVSCLAILLLRQSALKAGFYGLLVTVAVIIVWPAFRLDTAALTSAFGGGLYNTLNVSYVLLGGVFLYQVMRNGGALEVIANAVINAIPDELHRLLAIVFGVSVFFESATGFGVGILVTAPLFVALGYQPLQAATLALLGQCAVPWGALAIGTVIGSELSSVAEMRLGAIAAVIGLPFLIICGSAAIGVSRLWRREISQVLWLLVYCVLLCVTLWVISITVGVELAGCLAGLLIVLFAIAVNAQRANSHKRQINAVVDSAGLLLSLAPFAVLLLALLITRLFAPVREFLLSFSVSLSVGGGKAAGNFPAVYHAGFWLLLSALVGALAMPAARRNLSNIIVAAGKQWWMATLAVGGFLLFGQLMLVSGMTLTMAHAVADVAGSHYALVIAVLGGLGGFLTASNASSNALFMNFQTNAALQSGIPIDIAAGVQNASGSNTTLASPARVVFAASVVGNPAAESELIRRVLPVALAGVASASGITWLLLVF